MQNSNLSAKIFPNLRDDWLSFINKVSVDLQTMMTTYNNDKRRIKDLERIINKMEEISSLSKDNILEILNYKDLFMYIDNSLESSFDALKFFKEQNNFDNVAVKSIYERIINSPEIMQMNSEYNSLTIKITFDKERIKRLGELIRGSKIDYVLIKELVNKYKLSDNEKKNILFYPVVMLSIRQNDLKKDNVNIRKQEKEKFYRERFNELTNTFLNKKEELKDLLIKCFNVREKMNHQEIDMYTSFANNPNEVSGYDFTDENLFKIYTLSFFKIKKDIENFIDGMNDLSMEENDSDDELAFFGEMINEFDNVANKLKEYNKEEKTSFDETSNVFFALDAFSRLIIKEELLSSKNRNNIKALLQKIDNINNSKIEGVKTNHMLGVSEEEKLLNKNISMLTTSKFVIAYIMVNKSVLIIGGAENTTDKFDKIIRQAINRNIIPIKKQIALIEENDFDYIELQSRIIKSIVGEEEKVKTR